MTEIPRPDLLEPDRVVRQQRNTPPEADDLQAEIEILEGALRDSCGYATQLWERLDAVREYLVGILPPGPGFTEERTWDEWVDAYAAVTSVLAGPRGDSGFGGDEARRLARARREFPAGSMPTPETIVSEPAEEESESSADGSEPGNVVDRLSGGGAGRFGMLASAALAGWVYGRSGRARRDNRVRAEHAAPPN